MSHTNKLQLKLLGRFQVIDEAVILTSLLRPRAQRLLVDLLLHRQVFRSRESIAFTLWPDYPEKEALGTLRRALSELRMALPARAESEWFTSTRDEVGWNAEAPYWLDLEAFEHASRQATPTALRQAVTLYTGDLLVEWTDDWLWVERERLRQIYLNILRQLTLHHRRLGEYETALSFARKTLTHDPLAETAYQDLMALYYEAGDRTAALAEYDRLETLLQTELEVEPMAETQALRAAIVQGIPLPAPGASLISPSPVIPGSQARLQLIGREVEMTRLSRLWTNLAGDHGCFAIISGEAGVGKSHLAFSLVDYAVRQGGLGLVGYCYEFERALPYQAIIEMLRSAAPLVRYAEIPPVHRTALARLVPDVLGITSSPDKEAAISPDDLRAQLFEAILQAFLTLARSQPLLLLFEDMHWAAGSTLDWLTYIAPRLGASRLFVVITYRTNEVGGEHALARLEQHFARASAVSTISLKPLSSQATREWVAHLSGLPEKLAVPVADRLFAETAGNPFFLEEIVRGLIEGGQIVVQEGRWSGTFVEATSRVAVPLPESLRATIQARLERLREMARMFIRTAAVAGRVFEYELVRQVESWTDELALGALEEVLGRGFIRPDESKGRFTFTHHLVREVIYADLTRPRRAYLHRRLAEALQTLHPNDFEALAYHYAQAGDDERARLYYLQAGDHAWQLLALRDATGHYEAALARWPASDLAGQAEILHKLGQCQWVIMEPQKALASFEEARVRFETLGERVKFGDMERMIGRMQWELGDVGAAWSHYWRALAILEEGPETIELARAISSISQMYMLASQYEEAITWGERALKLAEHLDAQDVIVHVLNNIGTARMAAHDYNPDQGVALLQESLQRAKALGLPYDACRAYFNLADGLLGLSRYREARAMYEALLAYASQISARAFLGVARLFITVLDWDRGHWAEALAHKPQLGQATKGPWEVWAIIRFACIENDLGRVEVARLMLEPMLTEALQWDEMQTTVPYLGQLARTYIALGVTSEAGALIQQFLELVDRSPTLYSDCLMPLLLACHWYATKAEFLQAALACLSRLERANQQFRTPEAASILAEGSGFVALAEGKPLQAAEHFQQAVTHWTAIERPYDQARALTQLGRALVGVGEESSARAALAEALAIFETLAGQLDNAELRQGFLSSPLVREAREI